MNFHNGRICRLQTMAAALLAALILMLTLRATVVAQTQTVGVEVSFIERIEIARLSPSEASVPVIGRESAQAAPLEAGSDHMEFFVTALSVQATPGRAVTLQVVPTDSTDASPFLCTYGSARRAQCGGAGMAAISVEEAELRIDRGPETKSDAATPGGLQADIEITIIYQ